MGTEEKSEHVKNLTNAVNILIKWKAEIEEICRTLDIPHSLFMDVVNEIVEEIELSEDQIARIGYIIFTQYKLTALLNTPEYTYTFMSKENNTPFFSGRSPLSVILNGNLNDIENTYRNIDTILYTDN